MAIHCCFAIILKRHHFLCYECGTVHNHLIDCGEVEQCGGRSVSGNTSVLKASPS